MMLIGWFIRDRLTEHPRFLKFMLFSIPLPYIAAELGWIVAEVGRQPWIVYGLMKTSDAVSPVAGFEVLITLIGFIVVYGLLGAAGIFLMSRHIRKGPALLPAAAE
jgi:cytochrome d ubiquinol oxidase subunit I